MKHLLAIVSTVLLASSLPAAQPNIVFILADDMGYGDLGCYGHPTAKTPVIDRLAREGVRFTQHYANGPECSPTRTAFLTGRYAFRNWMDWRSEDFGKPSYLKALGLTLAHNDRGEPTRRIHALDTKESSNLGAGWIGFHVVDVARVHAVFFRRDHGEYGPHHDVTPLRVSLSDHRP